MCEQDCLCSLYNGEKYIVSELDHLILKQMSSTGQMMCVLKLSIPFCHNIE